MGASASDIQAFLKKRGLFTEVTEIKPGNFQIKLYSKSVDDVAGILAQISEGNRFIVSVHHPDLFELIEGGIKLKERLDDIKTQCDSHTVLLVEKMSDSLTEYIEQLCKEIRDTTTSDLVQIQDTIREVVEESGIKSGLLETRISKIEQLDSKLSLLEDMVTKEKTKPWWRKPWRSK